MKVVITGGCGFLGRQLAQALLARGSLTGAMGHQEEIDSLVLFDDVLAADSRWGNAPVQVVLGDIADAEAVLSLCDRDDLSMFHLASIMSSGGEADFDRALRVNIEGGRNVLEALRARGANSRLVFTSTLAVFGDVSAIESVGDSTKQCPATTYGATKAILELLVNEYTRKGFIDGRVARLPTVIVRPGTPNAAASSFASGVVREPFYGLDVVAPVPLGTPMAVVGHRTAVACLVQMHEVDGTELGRNRAVQVPGLAVTVEQLVESLHRLAGDRALGMVTADPDPAVLNIVASWPTDINSSRASALGLPRDEDVDGIVRSFIEDFGSY